MPDYHGVVRAAIAAVSVSDTYDLAWFGDVVDTIRPLPDAEMMREAAGSFLGRLLYRGFYLFGWPRPDLGAFRESLMEGLPSSRSARFVNAAVRAGGSVGTTPARYPLGEFHGEPAVLVEGLKVRVAPEPGTGVLTDPIEVRWPGISLTKSPGFVLFRSPHGSPGGDGHRLVRLYWNVTATGAIELIPLLLGTLGERALAYQFKVVHSDADWPERADTLVLYMGYRDLLSVWPALWELHAGLLTRMRPYVPALTREVGLGLGFAEDPGNGESHGMFVCGRISEGLMWAHAEGSTDPERRLELVSAAFESSGRSLAVPYAGRDPAPTLTDGLPTSPAAPGTRHADPPGVEVLTEQALRLARRIAGDALWHGDRCTWLAPRPDQVGRDGWAPMRADVYGGTAGLALFFAQLARLSSERAYSELALGAARQALATAADLPGPGLYSGVSGVGLAVALTGRALGETVLVAAGCELIDRAARGVLAADGPVPFDVIDGTAGALIALLGAHGLGHAASLDLAVRLGTLLVKLGSADESDGLYWLDPIRGDTMGFIGFAHGASGCAFALAELSLACGDPTFLDAAYRVCRYERTWYEETAGTWRDVRSLQERRERWEIPGEPDVYRYDWCYGAPGIALSRTGSLRVANTAPAEVITDARTGFAQARRAGELFPGPVHDVCVCHGAAGIAEILSLAPPEFRGAEQDATARTLLHHALTSHHEDLAWPGGHGLMLGSAGVALAALRRADPTLVSPLLLVTQRYGAADLRRPMPVSRREGEDARVQRAE